MARSGLYKTDVKKARDSLLAQGKHPSVDAVRIALGNTGSKTTIHKYLKELDEEEGGSSAQTPSISESLQDLIARLASQLHEEAEAKIKVLQASHQEKLRQSADSLTGLEQELAALRVANDQLAAARLDDQAALAALRESIQQETLVRHTAQQQVSNLEERLLENEAHRQSLEEKHLHARETLEHYRNSVKEQRDQDNRRHEQQIQQLQAEKRHLQQSLIVRQEDVTRLNQEGVRIVSELSHAQKELMEKDRAIRDMEHRLSVAANDLSRLVSTEAELIQLKSQLTASQEMYVHSQKQLRHVELELAANAAKLDAQQSMVAEWRASMNELLTLRSQSVQPSRT